MKRKKIKLGDCLYDPNTRVIHQVNGNEETLAHLPADLLERLYSNTERYVSNQELTEVVWSNKTVENNTIMKTVSIVRKALAGSGKDKYIETRRN